MINNEIKEKHRKAMKIKENWKTLKEKQHNQDNKRTTHNTNTYNENQIQSIHHKRKANNINNTKKNKIQSHLINSHKTTTIK